MSRRGPDPPDAEAEDPRGARIALEVTELHRVAPHDAAERPEGLVVWSAAELAAAIDRAQDRKRERAARWPARVRARYDRAVLLLVLDARQRLDAPAPALRAAAPFDETALISLGDAGARVLARSVRQRTSRT